MWSSEIRNVCQTFTGKVSVRKVYLNQGGYTASGVYFGVGSDLYNYFDEDGIFDEYVRADDRIEAVEVARNVYPLAKIRP